jgi:hypothetical protein
MRWLYVISYFIRCNEVLELEIAPKRYALAPKDAPSISAPISVKDRRRSWAHSPESTTGSISSTQPDAVISDDPYGLSATPMPIDGSSVPASVCSPSPRPRSAVSPPSAIAEARKPAAVSQKRIPTVNGADGDDKSSSPPSDGATDDLHDDNEEAELHEGGVKQFTAAVSGIGSRFDFDEAR